MERNGNLKGKRRRGLIIIISFRALSSSAVAAVAGRRAEINCHLTWFGLCTLSCKIIFHFFSFLSFVWFGWFFSFFLACLRLRPFIFPEQRRNTTTMHARVRRRATSYIQHKSGLWGKGLELAGVLFYSIL